MRHGVASGFDGDSVAAWDVKGLSIIDGFTRTTCPVSSPVAVSQHGGLDGFNRSFKNLSVAA